MRYFFVADIHANYEALQAVLDDMQRYSPRFAYNSDLADSGKKLRRPADLDRLVCLGDLIFSGPNPNEVIYAASRADIFVPGNHDIRVWRYLCRTLDLDLSSEYARAQTEWTANALSPEASAILGSLVMHPKTAAAGNMVFVHDIRDLLKANEGHFPGPLPGYDRIRIFSGHTHVPRITFSSGQASYLQLDEYLQRGPGTGGISSARKSMRFPISDSAFMHAVVSSCGHNGCAEYCVYDASTEEITFEGVPYDFSETQRKKDEYGMQQSPE